MAGIGYATLQVIPSLKGFNARLRTGLGGPLTTEGGKAGEKAGRSFASTFAKFAAGATAVAGVAALGKGFYDAAIESQKITKQTEAVLASMGGQAGHTAESIGELSEKLSLQSGIDDELIQGSQNVLLTFGKIQNKVGKGNKIFDRAAQSALDMSVALGTDLQGATIQVGKALNDPIKGLTALGRAGVSFTQQQKDQVKQLVATGKTMDAQKLILAELEKQFGGSAAAQATAGDRLRVVWGNLQEQLGAYLVPIVERVATWLSENLPVAIDTTARFFRETLTPAVQEVWRWFAENILPTLQTVGTFITGSLVPALRSMATSIREDVLPAVRDFGQWVIDNQPVLVGFGVFVGTFLVAAIGAWTVATYKQAAALVAQAVATLAAYWPLVLIAAGLALVTAAVIYAYQEWEWFRTAVEKVSGALAWLNGFVSDVERSIDGLKDTVNDALGPLGDLFDLFGKIGDLNPISKIPVIGPVLDKIPFLAAGGPARAGMPHIVGEKGPELFVPDRNGMVMPNSAITSGNGLAVDYRLSLAPDGAETAFKSWFRKALRVDSGMAA